MSVYSMLPVRFIIIITAKWAFYYINANISLVFYTFAKNKVFFNRKVK